GDYIMGSETEFNLRLARLGYRNLFCNAIAVEHQIRPYQLEPRWLAGRARRFGRGKAHAAAPCPAAAVQEPAVPQLFGIERWRLRVMAQAAAGGLWARLTGNRRLFIKSLWDWHMHRAFLAELKLIRGPDPKSRQP
ncbi:MAG: hypothetical protein D6782_01885, partial [Alphaproteobacteria bacterium]